MLHHNNIPEYLLGSYRALSSHFTFLLLTHLAYWSSLSWTWSISPQMNSSFGAHSFTLFFGANQMTEKQKCCTLCLQHLSKLKLKMLPCEHELHVAWTWSKLRDRYKICIDSIRDPKQNWYENARSTMYLELKYPLLLVWAKQQIPLGKSCLQMPNSCQESRIFFSTWLKANVFCSWLCSSLVTVIRYHLKISSELNNGSTVIFFVASLLFFSHWAPTVQTHVRLGVCQAHHPETALKRSGTFGAVVLVVVAMQRHKHLIDSDV